MKLKKWGKQRKVTITIVAIAFFLFVIWEATYAATVYQIKPVDNVTIRKSTLLNGVTSNGNSDSLDCRGFCLQTFHINISSGTATVTPQWSPDGGSTWIDGNSITTTGIEAYPLVDADQVRINVADCSSCNVTAVWFGRNK
jgi:hypothetical protein